MTVRFLSMIDRGLVEIVEAEPAVVPAGSVRVALAYAGVCHSDLAGVAEGGGPVPRRLGHEAAGTVVESSVAELPVGTRVVTYVGDAYATEVVAPAKSVVVLHKDCSLLDAALAEPLACVIGAVDMLDLSHASEVVVVGAGFMGLMTVRLLVAAGHAVTVVEPRDNARALAADLGAEAVLTPDEVTDAMKLNYPVVVEATGAAAGLALASDLVAIAGTLGVLGYHQSQAGERKVPMESWNFRALRVLSLHHRDPGDVRRWIDRAQRLSAHRIVNPGALVDATVTLDELPGVFAQHGPTTMIKTVLTLGTE